MKIFQKVASRIPFIDEKNRVITSLRDDLERIEGNNQQLTDEKTDLGKKLFSVNQQRYQNILGLLNLKFKKGKQIRVAFFVMFDSAFANQSVYEEMMKDDFFDPIIVVVPDLSRGIKHLKSHLSKTIEFFSARYPNVMSGYDLDNRRSIDISSKIDVVFFHNLYSGMSDNCFEISYFLSQNALTCYVGYSFLLSKFSADNMQKPEYAYLWKIFSPSELHLEDFRKNIYSQGENVVVTGYPKLDSLPFTKQRVKKRKKIIISPHHTIGDWDKLQLSNFLTYSDFFLKLPNLFPDIDFVFRPHPLLKTQLERSEYWGVKQTANYFKQIDKIPNMIFDQKGSYLDLFASSDGIIHDCGSFAAEYLLTGKPACYMLKTPDSAERWFSTFGKKCLEQHYKAFNEVDIINFIQGVVIKGEDGINGGRKNFTNEVLMLNHPKAGFAIVQLIKNEIKHNEFSL